jgi:hypothetical protein
MSSTRSSLRRLISRHPVAGSQTPDPADMGTCLGLEMALGARLPDVPQRVPAPIQRAPAPTPWWQRLSLSRPQHA